MKRALLVVVMLVICGGIGMGARAWMAADGDLEVVTVAPPADLVPLAETLTVDTTGMDTCPGFTTRVPGLPLSPPMEGQSGRVSLASVMLDDAGSALLVTCEGRTSDLGSPREHVAGLGGYDGITVVGTSVETRAGFPEMVRRDIEMSGHELSDRYFEHDGWLYIVGFLRTPHETVTLEPTVESILASWAWS